MDSCEYDTPIPDFPSEKRFPFSGIYNPPFVLYLFRRCISTSTHSSTTTYRNDNRLSDGRWRCTQRPPPYRQEQEPGAAFVSILPPPPPRHNTLVDVFVNKSSATRVTIPPPIPGVPSHCLPPFHGKLYLV